MFLLNYLVVKFICNSKVSKAKSMEKVKQVKQEIVEPSQRKLTEASTLPPVLIDLDTTESDSGSDSSSSSSGDKRSRSSNGCGRFEFKKRRKSDRSGVVLPVGFLAPLHPKEVRRAAVAEPPLSEPPLAVVPANGDGTMVTASGKCKQFWKAGDYEGSGTGNWVSTAGGMDRVRVHPRFLHSNATSHKWVLGAFAELLDNSLDEALNGATCVSIDMIESRKDGSRMLLIEDNGGGMDPDKMRQCMSLGYSLKSKVANTIGQYGNGFKTSTMRLGADVIVFSRCIGPAGKRPTQSIGLLSYTFLRSTGIEDIVVPMLDYERVGLLWKKMIRSTADWNKNVQTILEWSPFSSEAELSRQFDQMKDQGTRIIIYNLWEDDQGLLELDFDSDKHDIQIRGVNRDEKNIKMAQQHPNSRHFLTYRHSLRSYASILYLRIPPGFRIILRGKDVDHHNIVNDMMFTQEITYRPQPSVDVVQKDSSLVAVITMGFVKDATAHIDVQGYNVYHKNRLIKPFWRVWNAAGSDGRGVIGLLEADFVEPAHDKQGFERTTVLSRLETKLIQLQKLYWSTNCHKIGYAARRRNKKFIESRETSPEDIPQEASSHKKNRNVESGKSAFLDSLRKYSHESGGKGERHPETADKGQNNEERGKKTTLKSGKKQSHIERTSISDTDMQNATSERQANDGLCQINSSSKKSSRSDGFPRVQSPTCLEDSDAEPACSSDGRADRVDKQLQSKSVCSSGGRTDQIHTNRQSKGGDANVNVASPSNDDSHSLDLLKEENRELKIRLKREKEILENMRHELHTERNEKASLEAKLEVAMRRIEDMNKEQESLIDIFSEERERRDIEEENLRKKLKDASNKIGELLDKVKLLEKANFSQENGMKQSWPSRSSCSNIDCQRKEKLEESSNFQSQLLRVKR